MAEGIEVRHAKDCRSRSDGRCNCDPTYRASVWSNRDHTRIRKTFAVEAEAKSWRIDALSALSKGALRAPKPTTVKEAWDEWYAAAQEGTARNRSGDPFSRPRSALTRVRCGSGYCPSWGTCVSLSCADPIFKPSRMG